MTSIWDIEEKRGNEMFLSGKSLQEVFLIKDDFVRDARVSGYVNAKRDFDRRNFNLELEEQKQHFLGQKF